MAPRVPPGGVVMGDTHGTHRGALAVGDMWGTPGAAVAGGYGTPGGPDGVTRPTDGVPCPRRRAGAATRRSGAWTAGGRWRAAAAPSPSSRWVGRWRDAPRSPDVPSLSPSPSLCPQSFLLKRSGNSLNKEWKKKYVTLSSNGLLFYHPSINVSDVPVPTLSPRPRRGGWSPESQPPPACPRGRITSTAPTGRRWTFSGPPSRSLASARPAPSPPAAPPPASTGW